MRALVLERKKNLEMALAMVMMDEYLTTNSKLSTAPDVVRRPMRAPGARNLSIWELEEPWERDHVLECRKSLAARDEEVQQPFHAGVVQIADGEDEGRARGEEKEMHMMIWERLMSSLPVPLATTAADYGSRQ